MTRWLKETRLRGLCTCQDGSVAIVIPAQQCVNVLMRGGWLGTYVGEEREGLTDWLRQRFPQPVVSAFLAARTMPVEVALNWEAQKFIRDETWRPDRKDRAALATRWVRALWEGGLSEREAVALIVEKDAPAWSSAEIVDVDEIPKDRTYRDAWRRSSNGGPIWIDEDKAEAIMWERYNGARA